MRLLDESEEDMEQALSFAGDVEIVRKDALEAVEAAESIAPIASVPKAFDMVEREVSLGSLREGELLFRRPKNEPQIVLVGKSGGGRS